MSEKCHYRSVNCARSLITLLVALTSTVYVDVNALADETAVNPVATLRFCYEDKQLLPFFVGNGSDIPRRPGATIEHMRKVAQLNSITIEFIRLPWLRCLQKLQANNIDAVVADFVPERSHYTVFPTLPSGKPDPDRALNHQSLCLAYRRDNPLQQKIHNVDHTLTIARPLGYRAITFPANAVLVEAHSTQQTLDLVISGRVDATTILCQINGIDAKERYLNLQSIQLMYPPLHQSYGYLMFSKQFYQRYPELSQQLWSSLPKTMDKALYLQYLNYPELAY
jgi:polar amino acid transport system substrate-binding protein